MNSELKWKQFFLDTFGYKEGVHKQASRESSPIVPDTVDLTAMVVDPEIGCSGYNPEEPFQLARKLALTTFQAAIKERKLPLPKALTIPTDWMAWQINDYQTHLITVATRFLAQAVIDDDRITVKALLDEHPELLLFKGHALIVTSELTGQTFSVETILGIAAQRKQIEMIKVLMPYFDITCADKQKAESALALCKEGLSQWPVLKTTMRGDIPAEYQEYQEIIDELFDALKSERIPYGTTDFKTLSAETEKKFDKLFDRLLPDFEMQNVGKRRVLTKERHLDIEVLLYLAYEKLRDNYCLFAGNEGSKAFKIRVIGLLQKFLSPETAKIFCEGLYFVVAKGRCISDDAANLKVDDTTFYNSVDMTARKHLGFECLMGDGCGSQQLLTDSVGGTEPALYLYHLLLIKQRSFEYILRIIENVSDITDYRSVSP